MKLDLDEWLTPTDTQSLGFQAASHTWTSRSENLLTPPTSSGQYMAHLTELKPKPSTILVSMTITRTFCCQIISQNIGVVSSPGPWAAMYRNGFVGFWTLSWPKRCPCLWKLILRRLGGASGFTFGRWPWFRPRKHREMFSLFDHAADDDCWLDEWAPFWSCVDANDDVTDVENASFWSDVCAAETSVMKLALMKSDVSVSPSSRTGCSRATRVASNGTMSWN